MLTLAITVRGKTFETATAAASELMRGLADDANKGVMQVGRELMRTLNKVAKDIEAKHSNPWNGGVVNNSRFLQARTGGGIRSILESVKQVSNSGKLVAGVISTAGLTVHETGATIRPKRAKFLTIPLPAAMDGRGVPLRRRARDWDNTFVARSRKGNLLIFRKEGNGRVTPLYLLKSSVTIPPRLRMDEEVTGALPYFERRALEVLSAILE